LKCQESSGSELESTGRKGHAKNGVNKAVEKQASGRQPRRTAFWKAQHIHDM
jgi:hypothetical protein